MILSSRFLVLARKAGALWQSRLRRSARLYLAMNEPTVQPLEVEARLRLVERQLLQHLLRAEPGTQPLASSMQEAQAIVEAAQTALLKSKAEIAALLSEFSAAQAINSSYSFHDGCRFEY